MSGNRKYRISIIILLTVFLGITVLSFSLFFRNNAMWVEESNLHYLDQDSKRLADQMDTQFKDSLDYLNNIAYIFAASSMEDVEELRGLLENMAESAPFDNLYFTYPDGTSYRFSGENNNVADREYFQKGMRGESGITEPFISRMTGKKIILCYTPVFQEEKVCAVLTGVHYVENLNKKLETTLRNRDVYSAIISNTGQIIAAGSDDLGSQNILDGLKNYKTIGTNSLDDMVKDMAEGKSGQLSLDGINGTSLVRYRPMERNSWYLLQNLPAAVLKEMEIPLNRAAMQMALGLMLSFTVLFLALYLWIRKRNSGIYVENQRIRTIVDSTQSLILEMDENMGATRWYGDADHIFDIKSEEIDLQQFLYEKDKAAFREQAEALYKGKNYSTEIRFRVGDGTYHWCNCRLTAIRSMTGKLVKILGILHDIDEKKQKELALTDERDILAESISLLKDTYYKILMVNLKTGTVRYVKADPRVQIEMCEIKEEKNSYQFWHKRDEDYSVHPADREAFHRATSLEALRREAKKGKVSQTLVYRRKSPADGEYIWAQAELISCKNKNEVMIYVKDVTKERAAEEKHRHELEKAFEEVNKANHVKTDFLEYISHDFRTPMNAVVGLNQLAAKAIENGNMEEARHYSTRVHAAAQYLMLLLTDVLDVARIHTFGLELQYHQFALDNIMEACREFFEYTARDASITLDIEGKLSGEYVGDCMRIEQMIFNLLENAVKFNRPGGKVVMRTFLTEGAGQKDHVRIIIKDTGIGMSEKELKKLFEPFSRGKRISSETNSGTGMGLTIVKCIVDALGGEIHVDSVAGKGTTVEVSFDLERARKDISEEMISPSGSQSRKRKTVLIVDDNVLNLEIAAALIEDEGYVVLTAESAEQALNLFMESALHSIDIILTDIAMPKMDGYGLTTAIRSLNREDANRVCIVALSAYDYKENKEKIQMSGMNGFINKPLDVDEFNRIINKKENT